MFSVIALYYLRSRVKIIKRATFLALLGMLRISLKSILVLLPLPPS
jgi:hypothetical protein